MRIPQQVKVLFKDYEIRKESNIHEGKDELYGNINFLDQVILLSADSTEEQQEETLIHELVHAVDELWSIGLKERQVEQLGAALYMLVRDNPELFSDGKDAL